MKRLYVGLDDSNNGRWPRIIAAVFSDDKGDAKFKTREILRGERPSKIRINYSDIVQHMEGTMQYKFILEESNQFGEDGRHLVFAAPLLLRPYLKEHKEYESLSLFLDGPISKKDREFLRNEIGRDMHVEGVIKGRRTFHYPDILVKADSLAHALWAYPSLRTQRNTERRRVDIP